MRARARIRRRETRTTLLIRPVTPFSSCKQQRFSKHLPVDPPKCSKIKMTILIMSCALLHFFCCVLGAEDPPAPGSSVCSWFEDRIILPPSSCEQTSLLVTHLSSRISSSVARFLGSISNILPIMCRLSLGSKRSSRHGPLITCGGCWLLEPVDPRFSAER